MKFTEHVRAVFRLFTSMRRADWWVAEVSDEDRELLSGISSNLLAEIIVWCGQDFLKPTSGATAAEQDGYDWAD